MNGNLKSPSLNLDGEAQEALVKEYDYQNDFFSNPKKLPFVLSPNLIAVVTPAIKRFQKIRKENGEYSIFGASKELINEEVQNKASKPFPVVCTGDIFNKDEEGNDFVKVGDKVLLNISEEPLRMLFFKGIRIQIFDVSSIIAIVPEKYCDDISDKLEIPKVESSILKV